MARATSSVVSIRIGGHGIRELACDSVRKRLEQIKKSLSGSPALLARNFTSPQNVSDVAFKTKDQVTATLRVMQFNALAAGLCVGADNFVRCRPEALDWSFRKLRILEELLTYNADVICMQEIDDFAFFDAELRVLGYRGIWFPKPWSPCLDEPGNIGSDGCAVFYKTGMFAEISCHTHILCNGSGHITNQVMIALCLRSMESDRQFVVAVTHLKARRSYAQQRLEQGRFVLSRLAQLVAVGEPVLVCGDFNATPEEPVVEAFRDGLPGVCSFESAYVSATGSEPPYTTWKYRGSTELSDGQAVEERHVLDYIWCSKPGCSVQSVLAIPDEKDVGPDRLPCLAYPSDHVSLVTDLQLIWPTTA